MKHLITLFSLLSIFIFSNVLAQEIKNKDAKEQNPHGIKIPSAPQNTGDSVTVKDNEGNPLITFTDEGDAGSIKLWNVGSSLSGNKLYNFGGNLYWGGSQLGTGGSSEGWTDAGTSVYTSTLSDKVGIGMTNPSAKLDVEMSGAGSWQRGIRLLNPDLVSGDRLLITLGVFDSPNNVGNIYFYYDGDGSMDNYLSFGLYGVNDVLNVLASGKVGIGNTTPSAKLQVDGDDGVLFTGTYGNGTLPATGAGTRMMWYPNKAAFRAGSVNGSQWDDGSIGNYSTALGFNTIASGEASTALGHELTASGNYSTALGAVTTATGMYSTAMGYETNAQAYLSTVLGHYNVGGGNATTWVATDPLFEIGIGTGLFDKSNALTVLKNGKIGIGTATPLSKLSVGGDGNSDAAIYSEASGTSGIGVYSQAAGSTGIGIKASATSTGSAINYGGYFEVAGENGRGIYGEATNGGGGITNYGGYFKANGESGCGVYGEAYGLYGHGIHGKATSLGWEGASSWGGYFEHESFYGGGVYGEATDINEHTTFGGYFKSASSKGYGVYGYATGIDGIGVKAEASGDNGVGVDGSGRSIGVLGFSNNSSSSIGVKGDSPMGYDFWAVNGTYGNSSSIRWKRNIVKIDSPLEKLTEIRGVYFDWDEEHGGKHTVGCIAEEVGKVLPEIVIYEENGIDAKGMDYSKLTPLLIEAIKEQQKIIENLTMRIEELEKQ